MHNVTIITCSIQLAINPLQPNHFKHCSTFRMPNQQQDSEHPQPQHSQPAYSPPRSVIGSAVIWGSDFCLNDNMSQGFLCQTRFYTWIRECTYWCLKLDAVGGIGGHGLSDRRSLLDDWFRRHFGELC